MNPGPKPLDEQITGPVGRRMNFAYENGMLEDPDAIPTPNTEAVTMQNPQRPLYPPLASPWDFEKVLARVRSLSGGKVIKYITEKERIIQLEREVARLNARLQLLQSWPTDTAKRK
jgi:hypothetical protein